MEKLRKFLSAVMLLAAAPAWAQWGEVDDITVTPVNPTERSVVAIILKGDEGSPCNLIDHGFSIEGDTIIIDVSITGNPVAICPAVVVPFEFTQVVGSLDAGDYAVEVWVNGVEQNERAAFTVSQDGPGLTLSPPTGVYTTSQSFDFVMILEHEATIVSGKAYASGRNQGSEQWLDITPQLMGCLQQGALDEDGSAWRCPGLSDALGEGLHTLIVELTLSDGTVVSDAVNWTILAADEVTHY